MTKYNYSDFDTFKNKIIINGILVNESPLHIGSSEMVAFGPDNSVLKIKFLEEADGKPKELLVPIIPGSSLKGVFRSYIERIAKLDDSERDDICIPPNLCEGDKVCLVCGIFGGKSIASHIRILDAVPIQKEDVKLITITRTRINRITGTVDKGALFQVQAIAPGTEFRFKMIIYNIPNSKDDSEDKRTKLIINLLEALVNGEIYVGGMTSVGMGRIRLKDLEIKYITSEDIKSGRKPKSYSFDEFKEVFK
ncbi:MAG: type III CRISPR-associated RAMP protein Csx7 [Candidatus Asgardarchaeia archaeon]